MIRVIVVDDSLLIREMVSKILADDPDIEVVAQAADPIEARALIKQHNPDVITLDIEMPKMNGIEFLEKIMRLRPTPVVMLSTLTQRGAESTIKALEIGAVDCIGKPTRAGDLDKIAPLLREKIKMAAKAQLKPYSAPSDATKHRAGLSPPLRFNASATDRLIALGASTGGVEALREVIKVMPANCPPIIIAQHMPELFTKSFADRLDTLSHMHVQESQDGAVLKPGNAYIAHGAYHLKVIQKGGKLMLRHEMGELVSGHRPSVDVMFTSAAALTNVKLVAALLTGMGRDGAEGLQRLRRNGAFTIAEDASTCVVYGMPRVAVEMGAASCVLPLGKIAHELLQQIS